jgi:NADPH:quinone reductase-like Zn-dependent oxidoreductase
VSRRVQFDQYGPADVLHIVDVPRPTAGDAQILVRVAAAGINPGEIAIRNGALEQMFPATFPSGQGSDFAGRVVEVGSGGRRLQPRPSRCPKNPHNSRREALAGTDDARPPGARASGRAARRRAARAGEAGPS